MKIKYNDVAAQWNQIAIKTIPKLRDFFQEGMYIGHKSIPEFERRFANYCGADHAIGVSSGSDGLILALQTIGEIFSQEFKKTRIEVILPGNAYIADALAVATQPHTGPIFNITFLDVNEYYQLDTKLLEKQLTSARKKSDICIILPIHFHGHPADMSTIVRLANKFDCHIIEDASHAHGAKYNECEQSKYEIMSVYSLYPGKNLGAIGEAGIITTNSKTYIDHIRALQNYGETKKHHCEHLGGNYRMDAIQAIILNEKLKYLDEWNAKRQKIAKLYDTELSMCKQITTPKVAEWCDYHSYHIYSIRCKKRDELKRFLEEKNIPTVIHYPIIPTKTSVFESHYTVYKYPVAELYANEFLSLPMHPYMTNGEIAYITSTIKSFYEKTKI